MSSNLIFRRGSILAYFGDKGNDYESIRVRKGFYIENTRIPFVNMIFPEQIHSSRVVLADPIIAYCRDMSSPLYLPECDAVISSKRGFYLAVLTADCVPVLLYDGKKRVIAAVHSGREGTKGNIVGEAIEMMVEHYDSDSNDISMLIGPGISARNYEVSPEIFSEFTAETKVEQEQPYIDLKKVVKHQASSRGVKQIEDVSICTYDNPLYHSYRRDKTKQRQVSLIGLR